MTVKDKYFEINLGSSSVKLYNMDCLVGMREHVKDKSVDVVVTSPPYNIGIEYSAYDDNCSRADYLDWLEKICVEIKRVLKDDGSFFLNIGSKPSDLWVPFQVADRVGKHYIMQNLIHWIKSITLEKKEMGDYPKIVQDVSVGHYKPVNSDRYLHNAHEFLFHFTKTGKVKLDKLSIGVKYQDKTNIGRWKKAGSDLRSRGNTWFIPYKTIQNRENERPHPASFPVELAEKCIKLHGRDKIDLVLDPFNGIGNTTKACLNLGVNFIGFEVDEEYHRIAYNSLTKIKSTSKKKNFIEV